MTTPTHRVAMHYRLDGEKFAIGWFEPCGPADLCVGPEYGRLEGNHLVLRTHWGGGTTVRYVKVRD